MNRKNSMGRAGSKESVERSGSKEGALGRSGSKEGLDRKSSKELDPVSHMRRRLSIPDGVDKMYEEGDSPEMSRMASKELGRGNSKESVGGSKKTFTGENQDPEKERIKKLVEKYEIPEVVAQSKVETFRTRRNGFKRLDEYEPGELEQEFLTRVTKGDDTWVAMCLNAVGKDLIFSDWGGGVCRTSILYAAKTGNGDMCKLLMAFGGKDLLKVKDLKGRDGQYFCKKHGLDLHQLMRNAGRIDCWNYVELKKLAAKKKQDQEQQGELQEGERPKSYASKEAATGKATMMTGMLENDGKDASGNTPSSGSGATPKARASSKESITSPRSATRAGSKEAGTSSKPAAPDEPQNPNDNDILGGKIGDATKTQTDAGEIVKRRISSKEAKPKATAKC